MINIELMERLLRPCNKYAEITGNEVDQSKSETIKCFVSDTGSNRFVYRIRDQGVGVLQAVDYNGKQNVSNVYVALSNRRQGIASALFKEAKKLFPNLKHSEEVTDLALEWISTLH